MKHITNTPKRIAILALEQVLIALVAVLVLDVLWGVATRFLLQTPSRWTEEVATFLLIWVSLLGAALALERQEHLGVDFIVKKLHPDAQHVLGIVVQLVVISFVTAGMVVGGVVLVVETLRSGQLTPALNVKMGYVYLAVPISGILMLLSAIDRLFGMWHQRLDTSAEPQNQGQAG